MADEDIDCWNGKVDTPPPDDLVKRLLDYPEIDECAEAADKLIGLQSAVGKLKAALAAERARQQTFLLQASELQGRISDLTAALAAERERADTHSQAFVDLSEAFGKANATLAAERERCERETERADANYEDLTRAEDMIAKLREVLVKARFYLDPFNVPDADIDTIDAVLKEIE